MSYQWTIVEDAIDEVGPQSLQLDTAPYQLASNVTAFGLRYKSAARGPSCGEASWGDELTLFVPVGTSLRPVFKGYMFQERAIQGCLSGSSAELISESADLTVSIGKQETNRMHDLLITAVITTYCAAAPEANTKPRVEKYILHYNGEFYEPAGDAPWWLLFH